MSTFVRWFLDLWILVSLTHGFNVDISQPGIFEGRMSDSYFGYAVALHENADGKWALITAPKADSQFSSLRNPGVLYKCIVDTKLCYEIDLDRGGNTGGKENGRDYVSMKEGGWLGVSLDVWNEGKTKNVVTCAHLWKNQVNHLDYNVNGACYVLNNNLDSSGVERLLPFTSMKPYTNFSNYGQINYGSFAQMGMSASFSLNGDNLFLGAPGFFDGKGTVATYYLSNFNKAIIPNPPNYQEDFSRYNYLGYSVTSGKFFKIGQVSLVAGAPRDADLKGRIYIFDMLTIDATRFIIQYKREGTQIGEYFGASVLGVDLNNDGYTDLLVGSPLYTNEKGRDEGRVTVFLSNGMGIGRNQDFLVGSNKPMARFGMALANVGDLNKDSFNDVAIGAPFEDNGVVYIYHGAKTGFKSKYAQRIEVNEISFGLRGFGMSISKGRDIDGNGYNDFIVGAYESGHAVLLKSRPVVKINAQIAFNVDRIDIEKHHLCRSQRDKSNCIVVDFCLRFDGESVAPILKANYILEADVMRKESFRGLLQFGKSLGRTVETEKRLSQKVPNCAKATFLLNDNLDETLTPVVFRLNYSIAQNETDCISCPMLDPTVPNFIEQQLYFLARCRNNEPCISDIELKAKILNYNEPEVLILGRNKTLSLDISVRNFRDLAYQTRVEIKIPPRIKVINYGRCREDETKLKKDENLMLLCAISNPLKSNSIVNFQVKLDVSDVGADTEQMVFELEALTSSDDSNLENNKANLIVLFSSLASIKITGFPDREQILMKENSTDDIYLATHTFNVKKLFSSPIKSVLVALSVPISLNEYNLPFVGLTGIDVKTDKADSVPGSCNVSSIDVSPLTDKGPDRGDIAVSVHDQDSMIASIIGQEALEQTWLDAYQHFTLSCADSKCVTLYCILGPFEGDKKKATIDMNFYINSSALTEVVGRRESISIVSNGYARIIDDDGHFRDSKSRDSTRVRTMLVRAGPPPPEMIEWWKIFLSVIAGLVALAFIMWILVQVGFFRRQKMEQMEAMTQNAALIMADGKPTPTQDDDD